MPDDFAAEETDNPNIADNRGFYKVELWDKADLRPTKLIYAGNRLDKARAVFAEVVEHRPGGRYTIRQRIRVLAKWPDE